MLRHCYERPLLRENVRGGQGTLTMYPLLTEMEMAGQMTLCSRLVLPPHSSIGYHRHTEDVEYYAVLEGSGLFTGSDGIPERTGPGDVGIIEKGGGHGLENDTDEPLIILALVFE